MKLAERRIYFYGVVLLITLAGVYLLGSVRDLYQDIRRTGETVHRVEHEINYLIHLNDHRNGKTNPHCPYCKDPRLNPDLYVPEFRERNEKYDELKEKQGGVIL